MKCRTFHPHLHNNNRTRPGSHCMPGWLQLKQQSPTEDGDGAESREQRAETHCWPRGSESRDVESRCLLCSHREHQAGDRQDGCRMDFWTNAAWVWNRSLGFLFSLHPLTILACQFVIPAQQNDSPPPDLRGRKVGTEQDRLSGFLLIILSRLNYIWRKTISCEGYDMSKRLHRMPGTF